VPAKTAAPRATRARESLERARAHAAEILDRLEQTHPDARCALDYQNAYQLVMATILSAQCTDERVNMVTPALFRRYPTPADLAQADTAELEQIIRSTGFFRAKARSLIGCARAIVEHHGGQVPRTLAELVKLPGIGRKTANVVLGHAFDIAEGVAVDTHVLRVSARLGLTDGSDPITVEARLMQIVPQPRWTRTTDLIIFHGRRICDARRPLCGSCPVFDLCRFEHRQACALGQPPTARPRTGSEKGLRPDERTPRPAAAARRGRPPAKRPRSRG
jgi:endonuclease-3